MGEREKNKMTAATQDEDIAYLFGYHGMPDQSGMANGSGLSMSQLGYALSQVSEAHEQFSQGNVNEAVEILHGLYHFPRLIKTSLDQKDKTVFYTVVGEPVSSKLLLDYSIAKLKCEMKGLEAQIYSPDRNINKKDGQYNAGNGEIVPV
ncbi:hypothetical protein ACFL6I_24845 [candidate division KSB1 bacterium]